MIIKGNTENFKFFQSLSSKTRIHILEILSEGSKNIGELAKILEVSSTIMTRHITQLENAGLVICENVPGVRGIQRKCSLAVDEITIQFSSKDNNKTNPIKEIVSIPIGHFIDYDIMPTCGIASTSKVIGQFDDHRYFSSPEKVNASILWFGSGYVEYHLPTYLFQYKDITCLEITLEICSEAPGFQENYPSDIHFYLNNEHLGMWTSPGDFGLSKGKYTPDWWGRKTQYGLFKSITLTDQGTFIDGIKTSDITLETVLSKESVKPIPFRIEAPIDANYPGGITLFGKGFGNYDKDIEVMVY